MSKNLNKILNETISFVKCLGLAFILFTVINSQVFAFTPVKQSSMENTLLEDEVLVLDKISYSFSKPDRGDIVVFLLDESSTGIINRFSVFFNDFRLKLSGGYRSDRLIKRVIGIPGDEIDIQNGSLYVNGVKQSELYVNTITEKAIIELPVTVPEGYVFVLGDNRMVSKDSRHFGLIDIKNIEGKIILRASPLSKFGKP